MKEIYKQLYYSQTWTVMAAPSFLWATALVWGPVASSYYIFFTLATISVYGADRHLSEFSPEDALNQPQLVAFQRRHRFLFRLLIVSAFGAALIMLFFLPVAAAALLVGLFLVTVLQLVPIVPWFSQRSIQLKSLKQFAALKPKIITLVWWAAAVFIPVFSYRAAPAVHQPEFWWYSAAGMALIYLNAAIFDALDLPGDRRLRPGFQGLPGPVKQIQNLRWTAWFFFIALGALATFVQIPAKFISLWLLLGLLCFALSRSGVIRAGWRNKVLARFVLDGLFVISGPFTWLIVFFVRILK